jgi:O-acetyl-ADP-ribose deacetylase (regulator of RNase III)
VAFPAISTGVFGYPLRDAAHVSVDALRDAAHRVDEVLLVAFDAATAKAWEEALGTRSER